MYTVLIAEDEMLVRAGVKSSIDWGKFDMSVIADARDGEEAYQLYKELDPDIIITDIKMPVMDGMELISRIRSVDKKARIVILTCIEDLDLARKAISLGISGYLIKLTMTENEINGIFDKIKNELDHEGLKSSGLIPSKKDLDLAKEKKMIEFIFYKLYSVDEMETFIKANGLRLSSRKLVLALVEIDGYKELKERFKDEKGLLIKFSMLNIIDELLKNYNRGEVLHDEDNRYFIIMSFQDVDNMDGISAELLKILDIIQKTIRMYMDIGLTITTSSVKDGYEYLGILYEEASCKAKQRYFRGRDGYLFNSLEDGNKDESAARKKALEELLRTHSALPDYIQDDGFDAVLKLLKEEDGIKNEKQFKEAVMKLLKGYVSALGLSDVSIKELEVSCSRQVQDSDTAKAAIEVYQYYIEKLLEYLKEKRGVRKEIFTAVQFIKERYSENISLNDIAQHVNLSPNYIGFLFKETLHENFKDYLIRVRIEHAKKLLLETDLPVFEIAGKVGFSDESYFNTVFRKMTQIAPGKYRKNMEDAIHGGISDVQ